MIHSSVTFNGSKLIIPNLNQDIVNNNLLHFSSLLSVFTSFCVFVCLLGSYMYPLLNDITCCLKAPVVHVTKGKEKKQQQKKCIFLFLTCIFLWKQSYLSYNWMLSVSISPIKNSNLSPLYCEELVFFTRPNSSAFTSLVMLHHLCKSQLNSSNADRREMFIVAQLRGNESQSSFLEHKQMSSASTMGNNCICSTNFYED